MDASDRNRLIREGNAAFNAGNVEQAALIFRKTNYKDGLIRVGDHFYFEKHQPLRAYGFYRAAGHQPMMDRVHSGFVFALKCWLWETPEEKAAATTKEKSAGGKVVRPPQIGERLINEPSPGRSAKN